MFFTTLEGTLNSKHYIALIRSGFLQKARELFQNYWVLEQDETRAHTAKNTIKNLNEEGVKVLEWPARSHDLSPIENLWPILKRAVYQRNPKNEEELKQYVEE